MNDLDDALACLNEWVGRAEHAEGDAIDWFDKYEEARKEIDALRSAPPFRCDTHLCGSCSGCKAAGVQDELSRAWNECHGYVTRINAARGLHQPDAGECPTCSDDRGPLRSPCPTLRALDGDE